MAWQPTPVFLPGESYGQRNLVGYSPQGHKDSGTVEVTWHSCTQRSLYRTLDPKRAECIVLLKHPRTLSKIDHRHVQITDLSNFKKFEIKVYFLSAVEIHYKAGTERQQDSL